MKNFFAIVKVLLIQQLRARPSENSKSRRGGQIAMYVVLGVCFIPMLVMLAVGVYFFGTVTAAESVSDIVTFFILICQGLVLLFGLPSLISNVFMCRDGERLLALPVSSSTIFSAKIFVAYLNEVVTTAVIILVLLFPFGLGAGLSAAYFIMLLPALILIPMLPMLLGCIVSVPLSFLLAKIGRNGIVRTLFQILLFIGIMALYMWFIFGFIEGLAPEQGGDFSQMFSALLAKITAALSAGMKYVFPDYFLALSLTSTAFGTGALNFLYTLLINAGLLGLAILISLPMYRRTLSLMLEGGGHSKKQSGAFEYKNEGVLKQLIVTDFKRVMRDSQMGFQCLMGVFMMPLLVVIFGFSFSVGGESAENILFQMPEYRLIAPLALMAYMTLLGSSANALGLYPISRENKSFYMLKTFPIPMEKILTAKVILATAVMTIAYMITGIVAIFTMHIDWYYALLMIVCMVLFGYGSMCITTKLDLKNPKLNWTNFNQSLKNAKNSWAGLICGLIIGAIVGVIALVFILLYFAFPQNFIIVIMWLVLIGAGIAFAVVTHKIMVKNSQKLFDEIEA